MKTEFDLSHALEVALRAARLAGAVINHYARSQQFQVSIKADQTPVTQADVEAEALILHTLRQAFPDHAYYGEESGRSGDSDYLWLIDPLDGTKSFVRGYPMYSTQIALMHQRKLVLGVSYASALDEMFYATVGGGAFCNGRRIQTASTLEWSAAHISIGNVKTLSSGPRWQALAGLLAQVGRMRGYGDFYHYHRLAEGAIDLVIESDVNILDIAALAVIVREAGGVFTDLDGAPLDLDTRSVLAGPAALHHDALQRFGAAP